MFLLLFLLVGRLIFSQEVAKPGTIQLADTNKEQEGLLSDSLPYLDNTLFRKVNGSFYSFSYGWQYTNLKALNQALTANEYPSFSNNSATFGLSINKISNCWIAGAEGHMVVAKEVRGQEYEASLNSWYGFINAGYRILATQNMMLFPLLGFGGGTSSLKIGSRVNEAVTFDQLMTDPGRSVEISTGSVLMNLSLNFNIFSKSTNAGGFQFGLSGGYIYSLPTGNWYTFNTDVAGGPDYSLAGPYARIKFGYGIFN
jgi:hypothetical protein